MTIFQRTLTAAIAATALAGAFSLPAGAAEPVAAAGPATAPVTKKHAPEQRQHHRHADRSQGLQQLKERLQLQPSQQAAWEQYVAALQPAQRSAPQADRKSQSALTTPQRLDLARQMREARQQAANQRDAATRSFYASLNAEQQKIFDAPKPKRDGKRHPGQQRPAATGNNTTQ